MNRVVIIVDEKNKTLMKEVYSEVNHVCTLVNLIRVPVRSIRPAEMNTIAVTRLSWQVEYYKIKDSFSDGTILCKEWL